METCEFCYISRATQLLVKALGIERSWDDLKLEFNRTGPGYPGAKYYKTISTTGPHLFAVVDKNTVLYHDNGIWQRYVTATDVTFGRMNMKHQNSQDGTTVEADDESSDRIGEEPESPLDD